MLSISAVKMGAGPVHAVDVDPIAVNSARENIAGNGIAEGVVVEAGSLDVAKGPYDLVLVNILARIILSLVKEGLAETLAPGGKVIASGIIDDQEESVRAAFAAHGIQIVDRLVEKDWVALVGKKTA